MRISTLKITLLSLFMITWIGQEVMGQATATCNPNFFNNPFSSSDRAGIWNVTTTGAVSNISNNTGSNWSRPGYTDYTGSHVAQITPGGSFNVVVDNAWGAEVWIDWNNNGTLNDASDYYQQDNKGSSRQNSTFNVTVPASASPGKKRMRVMGVYSSPRSNPCYSTTWGEAEDYTVQIVADDDATISEIVSPNFVYCSPEQLLRVKVANVGGNTLNSVVVSGEIRSTGILGRIPIPTDTLSNLNWAPTTGDTIIDLYNIGSTGFSLGDTIIVWTTYPNGRADGFSGNDTLEIVLRDGLKGVYTVGDTAQGYDIPTLDSVVRMMNFYEAVCDTTWFVLQDTTFDEQIELPSMIGSSTSAPIIFRGESDTSETVIQSNASSSSGNNYVVQFNGLDHVYMENLTIKNTSGSGTYRTAVSFDGECEWITLDNTKVMAENVTTTSSYSALISNYQTNNTTLNNLTVSNSELNGGSMGNYFRDVGDGLKFMGNIFVDNYWQSSEFYEVDNVKLYDNEFTGTKPNYYHLDLYYVDGLEIVGNTIHPGNSNNSSDAIYMYRCNGTSANPILVANNMISHGQKWSTSSYSSIYMYDCNYASIVNNSILTRYNSSSSYSLEVRLGGAINVYNNNIIHSGAGIPVYYDGNANIAQSDHNNIYAAGPTLASVNQRTYGTLADYQNGTSFGANSISVDPSFYEPGSIQGLSDLHVCNNALDGAGTPIAVVTEDPDGDVRDPQTPDIGADEFFGLNNLNIGNDYGICPGDSTTLTYGRGVAGDIPIWNGVDTTNSITVNQPGMYSIRLINECGIAQDTIEIIAPASVSLPNDTTLCAGASLTADASIMNGDTYAWSTNEMTAQKTVNAAGTYFVTATDKWGCVTDDNFTVDFAKVASLNEDILRVCDFGNVELEVDANPTGQETYSWTWSNGNGTATTANIFELASNMNTNDTVIATLTVSGCTTTDTTYVRVIEAPSASYTDSVSNFVYDVLTNNSVGDVHMWDFGDGNTSTQKLPSHLYRKGGFYTVTYTVSQSEFDCGEETATEEIHIIATDVAEVDSDAQVLIYPNPNNGSFVINMTDLNVEQAEVNVLDMKGSVIYTAQPTLTGGNASLQVDLSNVEAGMYIVSMKLDGKVVTERISVQ